MENLVESAGKYCKMENQWICWRKKQKENWKIEKLFKNMEIFRKIEKKYDGVKRQSDKRKAYFVHFKESEEM